MAKFKVGDKVRKLNGTLEGTVMEVISGPAWSKEVNWYKVTMTHVSEVPISCGENELVRAEPVREVGSVIAFEDVRMYDRVSILYSSELGMPKLLISGTVYRVPDKDTDSFSFICDRDGYTTDVSRAYETTSGDRKIYLVEDGGQPAPEDKGSALLQKLSAMETGAVYFYDNTLGHRWVMVIANGYNTFLETGNLHSAWTAKEIEMAQSSIVIYVEDPENNWKGE